MERVANATGRNATIFVLAFAMKKLGYFSQDDGVRGIGLIVKFMVPCVLMNSVPNLRLDVEWLMLPALSAAYGLVTLPLLWTVYRLIFPELGRKERGHCLMMSMGHSISLVGIPIVDGYYGADGLVRAALFDTANLMLAYVATFVCAAVFASGSHAASDADCGEDVPIASRDVEWGTEADHETAEETPVSPTVRSMRLSIAKTPESGAHSSSSLEMPDKGEAADAHPQAQHEDFIERALEAAGCTAFGGTVGDETVDRALHLAENIQNAYTPYMPSEKQEHSSEATKIAQEPRKSGRRKALVLQICRNLGSQPPVIGLLFGLILRGFDVKVSTHFPSALAMVIEDSGAAAGPVTFFVLGLFFTPSLFLSRTYLWRLTRLLTMRYILAVSTAVAAKLLWPSGDALLPLIGGLCLLMPVPPVVIAYSGEMKYDVEFAALSVNASLILSFLLAFSYAMIFDG